MNRSCRRVWQLGLGLVLTLCCAVCGFAQLGMFSKDQRVEFTREWKGDRFPDGRPKVPDAVLGRLKNVSAEEAWAVLRGAEIGRASCRERVYVLV